VAQDDHDAVPPVHGYFSVDFEIVWDVVINKIPLLHEEIGKLLS